MIEAVIVDDHHIVRTSIARTINTTTNIKIIGEASSGKEAIILAKNHPACVVIMDLDMPEMDGATATKEILVNNPEQKILILTSITEIDSLFKLLKAGATGYIAKEAGFNELIKAINIVHSGGLYIEHSLLKVFLSSLTVDNKKEPLEDLSTREKQILKMLKDGCKRQHIANELGLSPKTISSYQHKIFTKLVGGNVFSLFSPFFIES